jgi:methionyl-tRNA formyltransferase
MIPPWLLELPRVGPVNVHPSDLPKWRGSSPGQFSLLYGDTDSAVCIMHLEWELDAGPILKRLPFSVPETMTQSEYYATAFALAQTQLAETIRDFAENGQETPQPVESPTPIAGRLERKDGFVPFSVLQNALSGDISPVPGSTPEFTEVIQNLLTAQTLSPAQLLQRMVNALSPWPGVWTIAPQYKDRLSVRLKILSGEMQDNSYVVTQWQYEGEQPKTGVLSI